MRDITFELPRLPPSVNSIYNVIYNQRRIELKPEVWRWQTEARAYIPRAEWGDDTFFKIQLDYHSAKWFTGKDKLRRIDATNLEKMVIDTMFKKWDIDDCRIVERVCRKVVDVREFVSVRVIEVDEIERMDNGSEQG